MTPGVPGGTNTLPLVHTAVPVALVVPEYGLLLDSPLHGDMDIHAFGNGDRALKGLWHLVMVEATAIRAEQYKLEPDGRDCSPWCHQDT